MIHWTFVSAEDLNITMYFKVIVMVHKFTIPFCDHCNRNNLVSTTKNISILISIIIMINVWKI